MNHNPLPHSHWRHYKSTEWDDRIYEVIGIAKHSETDEDMVIYRPLYEVKPSSCIFWYDIVARPLSLWFDIVEYGWKEVQRFTQI